MSAQPRVVLVLLAGLLAPSLATAQEPEEDLRPGVVVFPFQDGGWIGLSEDEREALGVGLQQILLNELAANGELRIVERGVLNEIVEELELSESDWVNPGTAAEVGRIVNARYVILPTFMDLAGNRPALVGNVVSVETTELLRSQEVSGGAHELYAMAVDLASDVTAGVDLPLLPSSQRDARRSREIPAQAVHLYSRAQIFQDLGQREQAIELYRQIRREFPAMTEADEALRQLDAV